MIDINSIDGFDWDEWNIEKNWMKHRVSDSECEEVFFNIPLLMSDDKTHSQDEKRYYVLGQTNVRRWLFIAFTVRNNKIRVISARDMNEKETRAYEKANTRF